MCFYTGPGLITSTPLPTGFGALSHINISSVCTTTRLLQCRDFGVYQCDISRKFDRNPSDVVDIYKEDFFARKKIVQTVDAWNEKRNEFEQFTPILWSYEVRLGDMIMNIYSGNVIRL